MAKKVTATKSEENGEKGVSHQEKGVSHQIWVILIANEA